MKKSSTMTSIAGTITSLTHWPDVASCSAIHGAFFGTSFEELPGMDVLSAAKEIWGVNWTYLDPSEIIRQSKVKSPEQLVMSLLKAVSDNDIEIIEVEPEGRGTGDSGAW